MPGSAPTGDQSHLTRRLVRSIDAAGGPSGGAVAAVGLFAIAAITVVDTATGPHVSLLAAYGLIVIAVAWTSTGAIAVAIALLAATGGAWAASIDPDETASIAVIITNGALRGVVLAVLGTGTTLLRASLAELSTAARRDPLTGLFNRTAIFELIDYERARADRTRRPLSIAYFDLDGLKAMNDRAGHEAGDRLIALFARSLTAGFRTTDAIARLGGDEFIALLPETPPDEAARAIRRLLEQPDTPRASCGLVTWPNPTDAATVLVAAADRVMYEAKAAGGGLRTLVVTEPRATETDERPR